MSLKAKKKARIQKLEKRRIRKNSRDGISWWALASYLENTKNATVLPIYQGGNLVGGKNHDLLKVGITQSK